MFPSKARIAFVACGLLAALLMAPMESEGGLFGCLGGSCSAPAPVTTYSIPYSGCASACSPCASPCSPCASPCSACPVSCSYCPAPYSVRRVSWMPFVAAPRVVYSPVAQACYAPVSQSCYYVPQTTYRWSYSRISSTRLRPVSAVDPCTGCPTTTYVAVTRRTLLPWLHRRPEVSYRMVCSPTCLSSCGTVCPTSCGTSCGPACPTSSTIVSGGSCCPAPVTTVPGAISSVPSVDPGYGSPPPTFKTEEGTGAAGPLLEGTQRPHSDLRPTPTPTDPTTMERPQLIMPSVKTAAIPVRHASYRQVGEPTVAAASAGLDVGGWRASQD